MNYLQCRPVLERWTMTQPLQCSVLGHLEETFCKVISFAHLSRVQIIFYISGFQMCSLVPLQDIILTLTSNIFRG